MQFLKTVKLWMLFRENRIILTIQSIYDQSFKRIGRDPILFCKIPLFAAVKIIE